MSVTKVTTVGLSGLLSLSFVAHVLAGDENTLLLRQQGAGNTIHVDQSNAVGSQAGGIEFDATTNSFNTINYGTNPALASDHPMLQIGNGNAANINVSGNGGDVFLQQGDEATDFGNTASIDVNSVGAIASQAAILQTGSNNNASVSVTGNFSEGNILQTGNGNTGDVTVGTSSAPVNNARATLTQNGDNNNTSLQVTGISAGEYNYTINGNNTTTTQPVTLITNGASISITQSQF